MIPSLLQIPSAVSDSKLHSVLPNNGKGDFAFDRSTGATRINKDGLIEEVGYFSSELVQNGDFSELGSELIVNGDFATTDNWNAQPSWSINNGKAVAELASNRYIQQNFTGGDLTSGKTYKIVFTVSDYITGNLKAQLGGGGSTQDVATINANGTYTYYRVATNNATNLRFKGISQGGGFTGKIDNVSVKQVDPNDRWALESNWAYGSNKVIGSATTSEIRQDVDLPLGKVYKTTFTIEDYVSGSVRIRFRGTTTVNGTYRSGNGTYTEILTSTGHTNVKIDGNASFTGSVTNISVVEVQGDRPRLSYDITNGVVEDKPHLLLEPSRTNSIVFSTALQSNATFTNSGATIETGFSSPDGENNATRISNFSGQYVAIANTGASHARSMYVKSTNGQSGVVYILDSNSIAHSKITISGEWQRFELVSVDTWFYIVDGRGADTTLDDILVFGFQQENSATYATSYIPTAGTTITRAAETCNNSKPSVNSTEGVLYAEVDVEQTGLTNGNIFMSDGSTSNFLMLRFAPSHKFQVEATGGVNIIEDSARASGKYKVAVKYSSAGVEMWIDGNKAKETSTAPTGTGINQLGVGSSPYGNIVGCKIFGAALYNDILSESQLMQLTGVTASSIYSNFVTRTASFTVEALNEVKKVIDNL